jgi:23S rRNA (adenine2503-C2)-methyltransferase
MTDERTNLPGRKKITVSTAGVAPKIIELANIEKPPKLAISLHATTNGLREKLMPITKAHDIAKLMDSVEYYYRQTKLDVTYEYILFKGMNDGDEDAERLARIGRRVPSRINIIPFNDISFTNPGEYPSTLKAVTREEMHAFAGKIRGKGVPVIVRDTFGSDIEAACGQLALSEEKKVNAS